MSKHIYLLVTVHLYTCSSFCVLFQNPGMQTLQLRAQMFSTWRNAFCEYVLVTKFTVADVMVPMIVAMLCLARGSMWIFIQTGQWSPGKCCPCSFVLEDIYNLHVGRSTTHVVIKCSIKLLRCQVCVFTVL